MEDLPYFIFVQFE